MQYRHSTLQVIEKGWLEKVSKYFTKQLEVQ